MTRNVAASVRQRLLNKARAEGRPFSELLQYFALERFLYRLGRSSYSNQFVLKGALMFGVWQGPFSRPTRDVDLLGHVEHTVERVTTVMRAICQQSVPEDDGLRFDADSVTGERIVVAAYLIAQRKVSTLVVVHRRQLLDQWIEALSQFLGLAPKEIGQIGGGKHKPTGKIDVAMVQSLYHKGVVDDLVGEYGHLVIDECHHISAVSFEQVVRQSKARYITGLSATVVRKDGHHPIIFMQCGPIRYRVDDRKQAEKRPFDHKVIVRSTAFRLPPHLQNVTTQSIQDVYAQLARDDERNRLIVEDVIAAVETKRFPVLLTERREHLDLLAGLLSQHIQNVIVMTGGMGKKQRQQLAEQIADIPTDEPRVIVATGRYLGEGFDDERLDTLFLALPISWRGTLTQYAGRLHRLNTAKKDVIIYDYVDFDVPVLAKMYARRRAGYRAIGYEIALPEKKSQAVQLALGNL